MFEPQRAILSSRARRRLLLSSLLARFPLGMVSIGVLLLVRDSTGSFGLAGLAVGSYGLLSAASSPVQGALVDRLGQRLVLVPFAVGQATALALLVLLAELHARAALIVTMAALAGVLMPPVSACSRALWNELEPSIREAAFVLDAVSQEAIWIFGPLLVGFAVAIASPAASVLLTALVTVVGALVFTAGSESRAWRAPDVARSRSGALGSSGLRILLGLILLSGFMWGGLIVALPALAVDLGSSSDAGMLVALLSLGSLAGGFAFGALNPGSRVDVRYRLLIGVPAITAAPLFLAHSLAIAAILSFIAGLPWAAIIACQNLLVGTTAPAGAMTEAFTWSTGALMAGVSLGSSAAGWLVDRGGAHTPLAAVCGAGLIAAVLALSVRAQLQQVSVPDAA
jgi:MFS family permease